jgi:4'-phosphopantetheinyl transferase
MKAFCSVTSIPPLDEGAVHVWLVSARISHVKLKRLEKILAEDEIGRIGRFRFYEDRARFAAGRAALRILLGRYARIDPASIRIIPSSNGKPMIEPGTPASLFEFSVSHSGGKILIAFSRGIPVGVDIERIRRGIDIEGIVSRYFAPEENEDFLTLPQSARVEAFFAAWTRKESILKARGEGLSRPPESFRVSILPNDRPRLIRFPGEGRIGEWSLADLFPGSGYKAALAVRHRDPETFCFDGGGYEVEG